MKNETVLSSKPEGTNNILMAQCVTGDAVTAEIKHLEDWQIIALWMLSNCLNIQK